MRQRGVALITAIVVVAIATVLAVRIGTRAAMDLRRTAGPVALDQGWHVALGAEAWAIEVLSDDLKVMDASAVALCRDNNIPIVVFNIRQPGNLAEVIEGRGTATIVQGE